MECEKVYFLSSEDKERGGDKHRDITPDQLALTKAVSRSKPGQSHQSMGYQETAATQDVATDEEVNLRVYLFRQS